MNARCPLSSFVLAAALLMCTVAATAQDILVGQIGPFTVMPTSDPHEVRDGALAYFEQVNRAGGVRGRKLSLFTLDDTFNSSVFMERFKEALTKHPVAILVPIGSGAVGELLKSSLLDTADIVIIGAIPGAEAFRRPGHPKLFHIRAGDQAQLTRILLHCKTLGISRVHVLHEDVAVGVAGLAAVNAAVQTISGLTISSSVSKNNGDALLAAAKQTALQAPEGVIVIGTPSFMADAVAQLRRANVHRATFALSYLPVALVVKAAGVDGARGLGIMQAFPNPNSRNLALQRDFQTAMAASHPAIKTYTSFHLEGYVAARTLVAGLRRIDGKVTPSALKTALHEMGEIDMGGFVINFSKGNIGSTWTDVGVISEVGKLRY